MKNGKKIIEKIRVKDLYRFACRIYEKAHPNDIIPIVKHRALAYANNPCADENDVGLVVGYIGNKCIGYLGIMPGLLKTREGLSKIHWFSTWFVPLEFRNTGIAALLIKEALSLKYDIVVTGVSGKAEKMYRALQFREIAPLNYCIISTDKINLCNLVARLLRRISKKAGIESKIFDEIIKLSARLYNPVKKLLFWILLSYQKRHMGDNITYKEVNEISEGDTEPAKYDGPSKFYRDAKIINWMLKYKCVLKAEKAEPLDYNYYFSEIRDIFKYIVLKVYSSDGKDYKGFLVLSVTSQNLRTILKILDFRFSDEADYRYAAFLALKYARIYLADHIELPDTLAPYIKGSILAKLLLREKRRSYFYWPKDKNSPLADASDNIKLNFCDGDLALA